MATRLDVIERAFFRLGIKADDEALTADQLSNGGDVLDALYAEASERALQIHGTALPFALTNVPAEAFLPLSNLLCAELAADYTVQSPVSRSGAMLQLLSVLYPDNRTDPVAEYY